VPTDAVIITEAPFPVRTATGARTINFALFLDDEGFRPPSAFIYRTSAERQHPVINISGRLAVSFELAPVNPVRIGGETMGFYRMNTPTRKSCTEGTELLECCHQTPAVGQ